MLAQKLKELREKKGISQAELANVLDVAQQTVASWEKEKSSPNYDILQKIADYFHVTTDELLGRETPGYFIDKETARIANEMKENPGRRVLFDATRNLSPEKIKQVKDFVDFITRDQEFSE